MCDEEEEGDVDAHETAEVPFGEVDEDAVGEEDEGAGGERPPEVFFESVADESVAADFEDGGEEEEEKGDGFHWAAPVVVEDRGGVGKGPTLGGELADFVPVFDAGDVGVGEGFVVGTVEEVDGDARVGDFGGEVGVVFDEEVEIEIFGDGSFSADETRGDESVKGDAVFGEPGGGGGEPDIGAAGEDGDGGVGGPEGEGFEEAIERGLGVDVVLVFFKHGVEFFFGECPGVGEVVVFAVFDADGGIVEGVEEVDEGLAGVHEGVVEVEADF